MNRLFHALTFPCLLATVLTLWLRWQPLSSPDSGFVLEMNLISPTSGQAWLRFNTGDGWNFRDTRFLWLVASKEPKTYRAALPSGVFKTFRLLPSDACPDHILTGARILDPDGVEVAALPASRYTADLNTLPFGLERPLRLSAPGERTWPESAAEFVLLLTVFTLAGALLARRAGGFAEKARACWSKAGAWFAAHPRLTLLAAAVLAVAASCHPIVFSGKSFVSPANGISCLYDIQPTLPGTPPGPVEQPNSTDMMATLWAHLPYSMVTHQAVFRDGELPLWNRYVMSGLTLLGQGQSMPGDPLFWLTVCADGAAWAWDLRFLLSKTLFALGIGLLVWTTTGRLGIAALLTVSSAFLGFFAFRFNHPAFFSVCYSPWLLLCWLRAAAAPTLRGAGAWALGLVAANWLELSSGTAKEASMLILGMNGTGALALLLSREERAMRWKKFAVVSGGCLVFIAISAPLWVVFFDTLRRGFTIYDDPFAYQLPAGLLVTLFDDLFGRQLMSSEWHVDPAVNFLVLLGVLWLLADLRRICANRVALAVLLAALPPLALVFGVIPPAWIIRVPLIRNIIHTDDTFISTLIVPLFVLAGFGLRHCGETLRSAQKWRRSWLRTLGLLGVLAAMYFGTVSAVVRPELSFKVQSAPQFSPFFCWYAAALFAGVVLLPWFARRFVVGRGSQAANVLCAVLVLTAFHFRHGMWLDTKFDTYVMNPQARVNLQARSPAVDAVRARSADPARTLGFGRVLNPGFNIVLGLESTMGADAVIPADLMQWFNAAGLPTAMWTAALTKENLALVKPVYDAMNIRYYLGSMALADAPAPGLKRIAASDLEVLASDAAWPRAFFTDRLARYPDVSVLMSWVKRGDGRPFAAVLPGESHVPELSGKLSGRTVAPARDYRLTANTTSFTVDAPHAGIAVLNESFVADDFRARINGQPTPVFRVNHIFKGVALSAAGTYRVEIAYWPHLLTPALCVALLGLCATVAGAVWLLWPPARRASGVRPVVLTAGTFPAESEVRACPTTNPPTMARSCGPTARFALPLGCATPFPTKATASSGARIAG